MKISKAVKLIEPNSGRDVTLQVTAKEPLLHMTIDLLTSVADGEEIKAKVTNNIVTLTFQDDKLAEAFRSAYKD